MSDAINDDNKGRIPAILEFARNLIESAPVGIVTYDQSGECVSANRASARILGTTLEKLLSQNYTSLQSWKAAGLLESANVTMATGLGRRSLLDFRTDLGLLIRFDCRFERFVSSGRRYLLQVVIEAGDMHD